MAKFGHSTFIIIPAPGDRMTRHLISDIEPGSENPVSAALGLRDRDVLTMVRAALKHGEVALAFQPVMQAQAPHRTAFYEGLIRIFDAAGRVIPAADFVPQIEDMDLGREVDCAALHMALKTLANQPDLRLSVNMSARSIGYRKWNATLQHWLARSPSIGERLILEITETSAMTVPELVVGFMSDLQRHGVAFALDDFGAGYTSFRHLRDFFFDAIKIDAQFIRGIDASPDNQVLVRALVAIGQQFDMMVVAEAVERRAEADMLVALGVDCLQGFLYGAPSLRPPWSDAAPRRATA